MARMFPAACPEAKHGTPIGAAERSLFDRLAASLGAEWAVIHDCEIRARGENGAAEFALLHRERGIALLGLAEADEEIDPEPVAEAMAMMLDEIGFTARFGGRPVIVAASVRPSDLPRLLAILDGLFAGKPAAAPADPTWPDWLLRRLVRDPPEVAAPRQAGTPRDETLHLRPPEPAEAWRVAGAAVRPAAAAPVTAERIPVSQAARAGASLWTGMGLAVVVVALVLAGMALLSHGNG